MLFTLMPMLASAEGEMAEIEPLNAQTGTFNLATGTGTGTGWSWASSVLTVNNGANITITGSVSNGRRISVAANATASITLNGVSITGLGSGQSPLLLNNNAMLNLTLIGTNTLTAGYASAGIQVPSGRALTITAASTGSLSATGGRANSTQGSGAGIGGGGSWGGEDAGTITIDGGGITATGGSTPARATTGPGTGGGGAGVGGGGGAGGAGSGSGFASWGGSGGAGGEVTMNGGSLTTPRIGGGHGGHGGSTHGGGGNGGAGGTLTMNGGRITGSALVGGAVVIGGGNGGHHRASGGQGGRGGDGAMVRITGGILIGNTIGDGNRGGLSSWGAHGATGTFTMSGNGIVFASAISDANTSGRTSGILVLNGVTNWLGGDFTLNGSTTIPSSRAITIPNNRTFTVAQGVTLTNNGTITNNGIIYNIGTIINNGTITNNRTIYTNPDSIAGTIAGTGDIIYHRGTIELSIQNPVFSETVNYGSQIFRSVTVGSGSVHSTGELMVVLSGANADSFTLSETILPALSDSSSTTFDVSPKAGLSPGTYMATITVSGEGVAESRSVDVSFTVNPSNISLSTTGTHTFPTIISGYNEPQSHSVTITNAGNRTNDLTITLSGANADSFTLSRTSIPGIVANGNADFTIVPSVRLAPGTYTATVTVSGLYAISRSFDISFTVLPLDGPALGSTMTYTDILYIDMNQAARWRLYSCGTLMVSGGVIRQWEGINVTYFVHRENINRIIFTGPITGRDSLAYLFGDLPNLTDIRGLHHFNTSGITDMRSMFRGLNNITNLDLSAWDTRNVTNMTNMLQGVTSLRELTLGQHFSFVSGAGLPAVSRVGDYVGRWQNVADGTIEYPRGSFSVDSALLILNVAGSAMADTWVWQRWADLTELQEVVSIANLHIEADYPPDRWAAFRQVLTQTQNILNNPYATQFQIDTAIATLQEAIYRLVYGEPEDVQILDIVPSNNSVTVELNRPLFGDEVLMVAVYQNGGVFLTANTAPTRQGNTNNYIANFTMLIPTTAGTTVRAFVWEDMHTMTPLDDREVRRVGDDWR